MISAHDNTNLASHLAARVDRLCRQISENAPCGVPVHHQPAYDAIREARREDDPALPTGIWQRTLKTANWAHVEKLAETLLTEQSKDLMVSAWLGEAWLHRYGLTGLVAALSLLDNLCETFWAQLHPLAQDGDESWRANPLQWLVRTYSETLRIQLPLPGIGNMDDREQVTLLQYQTWQRQCTPANDSKPARAAADSANTTLGKIRDHLRQSTTADELQWHLASLQQCRQLLSRLDVCCTEHMAIAAPSWEGLRHVLDQLEIALQEFHAMLPTPEPTLPTPSGNLTGATCSTESSSVNAMPGNDIASGRENAYYQLKAIADYLAHTEPHSPVPYLIYRAVEWGNKPLSALLSELIASDAEARRLWTLLGVLR